MASPGQVVGGRQPAGSGADDQHPLAGRRRRWRELPAVLAGGVAEKPLDRVDRHRGVQIDAVAVRLARVVADPAVDRGKRIVRDQQPPCLLVLADAGVAEPALDVLAGRACVVARRQQVDVNGTTLADRPGTRPPMEQIRQRREVALWSVRTGAWPTLLVMGRHPTHDRTGSAAVGPDLGRLAGGIGAKDPARSWALGADSEVVRGGEVWRGRGSRHVLSLAGS